MNKEVYHDLLKNKIWPAIWSKVTRNQSWYMQDGATCHTTVNNLQFLADKFAERVNSLKTEVVWQANSPYCNPLDFFFWGYVMQHVYRTQPSTIDSSWKKLLKILFHLLMLTWLERHVLQQGRDSRFLRMEEDLNIRRVRYNLFLMETTNFSFYNIVINITN